MSKGDNVVDKESKRRENERLARKALREMSDEALEVMVAMLLKEAESSPKDQPDSSQNDKKCDCK